MRRAAHILAIPCAAMVATSACNTRAFADDLPRPSEPMLAERGDWAADFNQWQVACFRGSMSACDAIWLNRRVLQDSFLYSYGRTCGGRVSIGERRSLPLGRAIPPLYGNLSRARMRRQNLWLRRPGWKSLAGDGCWQLPPEGRGLERRALEFGFQE